ncbi:nuclear pore membrane glycoprotein 210-like [Colossoma macropomum]|uniref:nuclear pore membrane glycoprotein 210-like n=1 Tax=Colossoma macropomum TaxID=42526 RepID=UPI00186516EE|nr:nuclear pore membrane glycoprotein 210-like [Colossoma macropomum]
MDMVQSGFQLLWRIAQVRRLIQWSWETGIPGKDVDQLRGRSSGGVRELMESPLRVPAAVQETVELSVPTSTENCEDCTEQRVEPEIVLAKPDPPSTPTSTRLNAPFLLLPSAYEPVNFTLRAEKGCYKWVSSRPEGVRVYPLSSSRPPVLLPLSSCSQYALVSALSAPHSPQSRGAAVVQAQDTVTGYTLRCDVITDRIQSIQIVTITRHLFIDDPPLLLTVQAMDSAGNTFSSLAGLEFGWQLLSEADMGEIVRFVRFSDTSYSPDPHILSLEELGQRGDSVLLQGVRSGSARVRVSLRHPEHKQVVEASVSLYVMDRLYLSPADDIYLLLGSTITYNVQRTQQEGDKGTLRHEVLTKLLSSDLFYLFVYSYTVPFKSLAPEKSCGYMLVVEGYTGEDGDDVVSVNQDTARLTALQLGHATVTLKHQKCVVLYVPELSRDPGVQHESASHLPRSNVHVVAPTYLTLSIKEEEDRWVLETGRQYHLAVHVHDSAGHVVHLSQNVMMVVELCDKFAVLDSSPNLSSHLVQTRAAGRTSIVATLSGLLTEDGEEQPLIPPIKVQQDVEIYEPLTLLPSLLVFPWQPRNEQYQYKLQVQGGSGSLNWVVSDSEIATVTVNGTVLAGEKRGQAHIEASDARNPLHKAFGQVLVVRPAWLQLMPQQGDCKIGEKIDLPLAVWGTQDMSDTHLQAHTDLDMHHDPNTYSQSDTAKSSQAWNGSFLSVLDCSHLSLHVHTEPAGVFTLISGSVSPGSGFCGGVCLEAVAQGHTHVTVTVKTDRGNISATATLAAYSPLRALVSEVLLTVGSSRLLVFEGGPQPWPLAPARFFSSTQAQPEGGLTVEELSLTEVRLARHAYRVMCISLGEQWLVFRCGNAPGPLNEEPSVEESRVKVECGVPASLSLSPPPSSSPPSIPLSTHHYYCPQPQYPSSLFSISSTRETVLQLSVFDQKRAQFDNFTSCPVTWKSSDPTLLSLLLQSTMTQQDLPTQTGYKLHGRQVLQPSGKTGTVTVTVTLSSSEIWGTVVSVSVNLRLVEDVQWDPRSVTLYNHPKVTESLTLVQGSGHFLVHLQDKDMASITYVEETNVVQISPLRPGFSSLLVHDLCLTSPAVAYVTVSDISDFQIDFMDIVEVGRTAVVRVRVLDSERQPFLHYFLKLMHLKLIPSSSIVTVEEVGPVDRHSVGFHVSGQVVGVVSLHLSAVDSTGNVRSSSHKHLQVYPRFSLQPRRLALALGSVRQVKWEGGPHPQSSVGFSVSDSRIASVTETGLVRGLALGVVRLKGALQTVTQDTGALLTFAQDEVEVEVFSLTAVRIQAPLVQMSVGTEMPVYVMGSDSAQNPLALGSMEDGLSFIWSLGKLGVLEIQPRHTQAGVSASLSHSFSVLAKAWSAGRTSLKVCVQPTYTDSANTSLSDQLTDEIQILVFEVMQLNAGTSTSILMSPHSQYILQSNKDSICPVRYSLCQCVSGAGLVTIDDKGVLRAGPDTGVALLEVIAMEECGINQTLLITVKVSAVWFVRAVSESSLHSDGDGALPAFPLGWRIRITALCYDNLGQRFHAHNTHTHITTNRDDLVQVTADTDSHSFLVQTVSPGLTVLGIEGDHSNPALCDYTPLPVLPAISAPPAVLRPGDTVCFSSPLTDRSGQHGTWDVSSNQILQVDPETGAALAKNSGTVVVYYRLEEGQRALREVTVEAASAPALHPPENRLLTNWPLAPDYIVSVELYTSAANTAQCSLRQQEAIEKTLQPEAELRCLLHFSTPYVQLKTLQAVFQTAPLYYVDTAQYGCRISVRPQSDSVLHLLSSFSLSISLYASLQAQSPLAAFPLSPPASVQLPYVPAFHCPNTHINLTPQQPAAEITVTGTSEMLNNLKFHSDNPDVMLSEPSLSAENSALCLVSVYLAVIQSTEKASHPTNITIYTSLSPQTHIVRVTVLNDSQMETGLLEVWHASPLRQLFDFQLILLFVLFAVLAVISIMFIVYNSLVHRLQTVPVVYMPPVSTVPAVKQQFSPWISQSPQLDRILRRRPWLCSISRTSPPGTHPSL